MSGRSQAEGIEIVGMDGFNLSGRTLIGGGTVLRLNDCHDFYLGALSIYGMEGPIPPNGHGIQLINCSGIINGVKIVADEHMEDGINVYGDREETEKLLVRILAAKIYGQGVSGSGNGGCVDGEHPPMTVWEKNQFVHNRCGLTISGGSSHQCRQNIPKGCTTDLYIYKGYTLPPRNINLTNSGFKNILNEVKGSVVHA